MTNNDFFRCSDLPLSSALLCLGFCLEAVEKGSPKSIFIFKRSDGLDNAVQAFWSGNLSVEPKSYFNCIKEIKSRLYSQD